MTGWLVTQLPRAMAADPLTAGLVRGCEEVADSVRDRVSSVEHEVDVDLASPEMLSYVAGWLGIELEAVAASDDADARAAQRRLIRAVGQVLGWRGTRRAVETLLEALTGARAEVLDSGGVFGARDVPPPQDDIVRVVLNSTGALSERQIRAFLADELPVTARVELRIRSGQRDADAT